MANTTTFGGHQEVHIGQFNVDRRGLITGSIQRHVAEAPDELDFSRLALSACPAIINLPCVGVSREYDQKTGNGIYTYTQEGIDPEQPDDEDLITFELDITQEEIGIEAHPNFDEINDLYGPFDEDRKRWPKDTDPKKTKALRVDKSISSFSNPLYGTDSYIGFGGVFRKKYCRTSIPASIVKGIGTLYNKPPGLSKFPIPTFAKGRQWLKVTPKVSRRGNCVEIEESWLMTGRRSIIPQLYSAAALQETAADGLRNTTP